MKFELKSRAYLGAKVLFTDDIPDDTPEGLRVKAVLQIAVKARANLAGANLARANLAGAKNLPKPSPEEIMRLDEIREIVLARPERLDMSDWHSGNWEPEHTPQEEHACGSAHCIAGWLQALCDDPKIREMDAQEAGWKLAPAAAASGIFFVSDELAREWFDKRKYVPAAEEQ